jgi:Tfp pilus assembly protein PilO
MKLTSTQKIIIIAVAVAAVAAVVFFLLILPQFSRVSTLDAEIAQAQQDIESARTLLEQRQAIKARAAETEARLLSLSNEVPESPELPSVIIELQDAVNAAGLDFVSITPQVPEQTEGGYSAIAMSMNVNGTWPDYVDLLQRLKRVKRQIRIVGTNITRIVPESAEQTPSVEPENRVDAQIDIEVYTMSEPTESAAPAVPAPPTGQ